MYARLYDSFVTGYSSFYGANFAHTIATWMLAALAFANSFCLVALLANGGVPWAAESFRILKNTWAALALAAVWLLVHYILSAHYRRVLERSAAGARMSKWPGNLYTLGTVAFCYYVSKGLD